VNEFAVDLSTGFIDVVKDRLYTSAPDSMPRRSPRPLPGASRSPGALVAPVMSFTADELVISACGCRTPGNVHPGALSKAEDVTGLVGDPAGAESVWKDFETLMKVRDAALKHWMSPVRKKSLAAHWKRQ